VLTKLRSERTKNRVSISGQIKIVSSQRPDRHETHSTSYLIGTRGIFSGAEAWSWPFASFCCLVKKALGAIPPVPTDIY
jgi:hypothetical protein